MYGERGERLIALDLSFSEDARARLERAAGEGNVHFEEVDVRDGGAVAAAVQAGAASVGDPRLAINCAGIVIAKPFDETSEDEFERVVQVNLFGSRNVAAAVLPYLKNGGHLVLFASMAGFVANYGYAGYNASKFGVVGLAELLRLEQKPNGVDVSVVAPPEVMTPMVEEERRSGSALTGKMKQFAGSLELEPAVRMILKGIDSRKFLIVPGAKARQTLWLSRFAPRGLTHSISDRLLRRATN
jgi:NAD(P)-dependent dehydrogenase (short-subunit alcohol dehydrogenase family)